VLGSFDSINGGDGDYDGNNVVRNIQFEEEAGMIHHLEESSTFVLRMWDKDIQ
jgi:hypothetical protein